MSDDERERHRQAAYLYSVIQSAENSEDGGPDNDVEKAYDAGIMYAARALLDNWAGDNDWTSDLHEYADEIHARTVPGTPLPDGALRVVEAAGIWREAIEDDLVFEKLRAEEALIAAVAALEDQPSSGEG